MPHKFNAARRHKFPKKRYRVTNWAEYTEILRRRGDLTIWVTDDTLKQWRAPRRTTPGGQPHSALGYTPPAPQTIVPKRTDPAFAIDGLQPDQPFPETVPRLT